MKRFLAILLTLSPATAYAGVDHSYQPGYSESRTCFKTEYREEYVPGTENSPGYVKSWKDTLEVPCHHNYSIGSGNSRTYRRHVTVYEDVDTNSCAEGSLLGGILGGGIGAAASRKEGRLWAIPLGVVSGAMLGCQIDGG